MVVMSPYPGMGLSWKEKRKFPLSQREPGDETAHRGRQRVEREGRGGTSMCSPTELASSPAFWSEGH